jgi:hypothetical protein
MFDQYILGDQFQPNDEISRMQHRHQFYNYMQIYVDSMMYEPANITTLKGDVKTFNQLINIFGERLQSLHEYLEDFARG